MKTTKFFVVLSFLLVFASGVLCQKSEKNKNTLRYPNELKGFRLMKTSKLKVLVPGLSTKEEVVKVFGDECKNQHKRIGACELDKDWYVKFLYQNKLSDIEFYPRKRIPFSKIKFSKKFTKGEGGIFHFLDASYFIVYTDDYGLQYWIVNESGDSEFKKGDLLRITYSVFKNEEEN